MAQPVAERERRLGLRALGGLEVRVVEPQLGDGALEVEDACGRQGGRLVLWWQRCGQRRSRALEEGSAPL